MSSAETLGPNAELAEVRAAHDEARLCHNFINNLRVVETGIVDDDVY